MMKNKSGFTLIELLIVLTIAGIFISMIATAIYNWRQGRAHRHDTYEVPTEPVTQSLPQ